MPRRIRSRRRLFGPALVLALVGAIVPGTAGVAHAATPACAIQQVNDVSGDANGLPGDRVTDPASYDPADLLTVCFRTDYVAQPLPGGGVHYEPTGISVVFETLAAPVVDDLTIRLQVTLTIDGCQQWFDVYSEGAVPWYGPSASGDWGRQTSDCSSPLVPGAQFHGFSATVDTDAHRATLTIPFDSLSAGDRAFLAPGTTLVSPSATSLLQETAHVIGGLTFNAPVFDPVDSTPPGDIFTIGQDVPPDS